MTTTRAQAPGATSSAAFDPLAALRRLPGVSATLDLVTTFGIQPVTALLESAAYLPLVFDGAAGAGRRFVIATREFGGRISATNRTGAALADGRLALHPVADDAVVAPGEVTPAVLPEPGRSQRLEVSAAELGFPGAGETGYRAFGAGRTYPSARQGTGGDLPFAAVLDLTATEGQLAGLTGTVTSSGALTAAGQVTRTVSLVRVMDPDGGLLTACPLPSSGAPGRGAGRPPTAAPPGVTYLAFLGEVDPEHPVTLRLSLTEGILGSNVFELLRPATLDCTVDAAGRLLSHSTTGPVVGSVAARLSFNPLSLCSVSGVQTREGVFVFHDCAGREIGRIFADMLDGRAFRTFVGDRLLPFFRFGGSGPIRRGTGTFAGARGLMLLNAVISVQPRTLSNLYLFRLDDPEGRYRDRAAEAWS